MAIRGLRPASVTQFQGKNTSQNLTDAAVGTMLSARNIMVLADNQVRRAPGYSLVNATGLGPVHAIYDFQRSVDQKQFILAHIGSSIIAMSADGSNLQVLSDNETNAPFQFVCNAFVAYGSNGVSAWRFVDNAGTLTKYKWGIAAPTTAAAISTGLGTLTLTYGRQYVYCNVAKYTDSLGIQRISIGPPSPLSAHSGPVANEVVNLTGMQVSTDPQVGYKWIFATTDSPINTSASYFFAAEIASAQTSWGDTLLDAALDQTRLAPYDNNPAPPAPILTTFQNRVVAVNGGLMQLSAHDEILLGIPEESWPISLFFNIPGGARTATAAIALNQGTTLAVCTLNYWYAYSGYDASTFTEQDRIASPGAVGPNALCMTPFGVAFLSESQRWWLWSGTGSPTEVSSDIAQSYPATYGMEDLASLPLARAHWYSFGKRHFLAGIVRTADAPDAGLNLVQLWNVSIKGSQSSGEYTGSSGFFNQIGGLYQTDKLPTDTMTASGDVKVADAPYIFTGDALGNIYRFPDTFTDNGNATPCSFSTPWMMFDVEGKKRFYWADLYVEVSAALLKDGSALAGYKILAATTESPDTTAKKPIPLELTYVPSPDGVSEGAIRGNLQQLGTNVGKYLRLWVVLPSDLDEDEVILKMVTWYAPLYVGVP